VRLIEIISRFRVVQHTVNIDRASTISSGFSRQRKFKTKRFEVGNVFQAVELQHGGNIGTGGS